MSAYYNEIDRDAAHVLRALIAEGVIAPGDVDERSIKDVQPDDLRGYTQAHFFAGGGLWSVAARLAGWPDKRPLWTGSCPCQPFSQAGKQAGTDDPRHLWPDFFRLIRDASAAGYGPPVAIGEQVGGALGQHWFDGVSADLASIDFASRSRDIPACAVDAPHQRNRIFWIAEDASDDRQRAGLEGFARHGDRGGGRSGEARSVAATDDVVLLDAQGERRREGRPEHEFRSGRQAVPEQHGFVIADSDGLFTDANESVVQGLASTGEQSFVESDARSLRNGSFWSDAEWIVSPLDGKARRAKPGIPFLVDGLPGRVGLWRIGGNAISPVLAAEVIGAYLDCEAA